MTFLALILPIIVFILFFTLEKRSLWIGFFFMMLTIYIILWLVFTIETINHSLAIILGILFLVFTLLLFPFYLASFVIALITSGIQLIKREGMKLSNLLGFGLCIFIILWTIITLTVSFPADRPFLYSFAFFANYSLVYLFVVLLCFITASVLNHIRNPWKTYDYIIVLGSGLTEDHVPPLLADRIDKGIHLLKQSLVKNKEAKIIFTGGQGENEGLAEGKAMAHYAEKKGLAREHIFIEDKSKDTYENILFSTRLMDAYDENIGRKDRPRIITITNNFHLFRALLWTRRVGIKSDGAGAKTKFYFWLNALIREFIGVLFMQRAFHLYILGLGFLLAGGLFLIQYFVAIPYDL